ncbi:MAG: hypothetical protein CES88_06775 [Halobacteriovorax sp. JY17]|nr:MAG: hypothetical protein CES88_06775 [Halobacteriovorax sp. JY17]
MATYSLSNFYGPYYQYWANQIQSVQQDRSIASSIGSLEYDAYKDYFYGNAFNKYLNYKISSEVWSSGTTTNSNILTVKAFQEAIQVTLEENKTKGKPIVELFQENILSSSTERFIKLLKESGMKEGKFQVDIHFQPQFEQSLSFKNEQSTNQLVNINHLTLKEELEKSNPTITESVFNSKMSSSQKRYQYSGGTISVLIDLKKIKKEEPIAQVRFRRYFRADDLTEPDLEISSNNLKVKMLHLVSLKKSNHNFITVDLYKDILLSSKKSKRDRLEIFFGKLVPSIKKEGKWLKSNFSQINNASITTGDFFLHGRYTASTIKLKTKIKVEKLVYSFEEKKFTKDSLIYVQLNGRVPASIDKLRESFLIKNIFRENIAEKLIRSLELDNFLYVSDENSVGSL